ncbi:haloacid dehalogenase type II [Rhodovibrionaceae bacterium A322]
MTNSAFSSVKACVFDAYGTLFDVHSAAGRASDSLGENAQAISALWRQKQLEYTWLRSLMGQHVDFWQVTGDSLDFALASHNVDDPDLRARLMDLYLSLTAYADVAPTLKKLKAGGMKTAILSNGEPRMLQSAVESAGLSDLLDDVQSVESVGVYKPDNRVYQMTLDRLGVRAEEVAFVSTNCWDAVGATYFGFNVAWMNRFGMEMENLGAQPACVISGLDELPALVGL